MMTESTLSAEAILRKLVSFPVLGGESNLPIAQWIRGYMNDLGVVSHTMTNDDHTKIGIHARIGPPVDGGIILSGHMDVVPVEGQDWDTNPFEVVDDGKGKLYGRGTCDMKGFLACCLHLIPEMMEANLKKPIYLAFSYDEEVGCQGAPALIDDIGTTYAEKPKYAIIGEPTMMQPVIGQKGICVLETTVNGSAGHSSRIRQEVSAVHEAARLIVWIEEKMNELIQKGHLDDRFDPPHSSMHVGSVTGGIAPNVIADQATFEWDMRVIPGNTVDQILDEFHQYCAEREEKLKSIFPDFKITTTMGHYPVPPLDTSADSDILKLVQKLTGNHRWETVSYAAEAGQFSEAGYESIICGPGSIAQAHRANEFLEKEQLQLGIAFVKNLIQELSL
ncbi:acetylornithine deacetylase [Membranihabitans marinus]|nr:acetylornithine deacetylase [Membranihabitans marinus]